MILNSFRQSGSRAFLEFKRFHGACRGRLARARTVYVPNKVPRNLPRTIWIYWDQGLDNAPDVVSRCIDTWVNNNPGWKINVLSRRTLEEFVDVSTLPQIKTLSHFANIVRTRLLYNHGGAWADATCICTRPLEQWLPHLMGAGFFVFHRPHPNRILSNWFIASEREGELIGAFERAFDRYWTNRERSRHYFWYHYLVEYELLANSRARRIWSRMPKVSADGPHLLQRCLEGREWARQPDLIRSLDRIPVHKLSWKKDFRWRDVEQYLEASRGLAA